MEIHENVSKYFMKYRFLRRLSLRGKINLVVAVIFTAIVVLLTIYNVNLARETYLSQVKSQGKELATLYFDSLNTMMLTGSMEKRSILRDKMLNRDQVIEARIIRGEPVNKQFGPGFQDELPMDDLDLRALQGQESLVIKESANERIMTIVKPFKATKDTLGVDCLQCHEVEEGAVNGAVRISLSLSAVDRAVQKEMWETIIGSAGFLVLGLIFVNMMMKIWIINPLSILLDVVRRRVDGDTKVRATTVLEDEIGDLSNAFNIMSNTTDAAVRREREQMEKEHATAQELREKVDALLDVVNKVAEGDYNVEVPFEGQDTIGELARQLQIMIGFIRQSSEDKREALELLKRRVDNMLEVVSAASNGNLTGHLEELGDDEIGQLAKGFNGMIDSLNDLVSQVQNSGIQVTSSATSIAATAKQQEATAAEQAATTSQIVSTATEISTTARELVNTMDEVADVSVNTTQSAESGYEGLRKMQATMENVVGAASGIASKFEIINERAANINTVVTTITKVADQTNLLSLNAAIEAEKAGEYGYGFSVVAKEIRRLADQTAVATLDIEQMVKEMQSAVSSGVMSMEKFSDHVNYSVNDVQQVSAQLVKIIEEVQALTPRFDSVHEGMQFQAKGADQINQSMIQLNDAASQTVESLRDSNSVIDNLNKAARTLQKGISNFNIRRK